VQRGGRVAQLAEQLTLNQ